MVDINLIGDDKTGEEERVEDFTQTSSMDTQELAFEERTETFDTTKTAGLTRRRSFSSVGSTLIIVVVIALLSAAVYYFFFSGSDTQQQDNIPAFNPADDQFVETAPQQDLPLDSEEPFTFEEDDPVENGSTIDQALNPAQQPPVSQPRTDVATTPRTDVVTTPRTTPRSSVNVNDFSSRFLSNSRASINSVTSILTSIPSSLNTTLLSYAGERVRIELIAGSSSEARDFVATLNQSFGRGSFKIISEEPLAANGRSMNRALVSGSMSSAGQVGSGETIEFLTQSQAEDRIKNICLQYGLQLRQLRTQQGTFTSGYQKIPIFVRIYGDQSSIVGFLQEISGQSINVELTKIQLVSPDMATFSDDSLVLVAYMFLYQQP